MNLWMAGVDYQLAPIALREQLSFSKTQVEDLNRKLSALPEVEGCVLLSTCNRTELYITAIDEEELSPAQLLCQVTDLPFGDFEPVTVRRSGQEAAQHLMEVACGLKSQIWGEDQILTQVKTAAQLARAVGSSDSLLETLFRTAAAAGKQVKTGGRLCGVPTGAAEVSVALLKKILGKLSGKSVLVVGNGEMGRLAASLLVKEGCQVTVTLRTYHHGVTVVPGGCKTVDYDKRYQAMEGVDILLSATTSPHHTVLASEFAKVVNPPKVLVDLALPRDIDPAVESEGILLYNMDSLGVSTGSQADPEALVRVQTQIAEHMERFLRWNNYHDCLPAMEEVKTAILQRVMQSPMMDEELTQEEIARLAVQKAVDLLAGSLQERMDVELLEQCAQKIRANTTGKVRPVSQRIESPFRFPLFVDLKGKPVVVVGAGVIASRRIGSLLSFGADITVIAPHWNKPVDGVRWLRRVYEPGDLTGASLAVTATDSRAVNQQVGEDAKALGIPVSVADRQEECSFFFPAVCLGEHVVAGVVSKGNDHHKTAQAAKAIRARLEELG